MKTAAETDEFEGLVSGDAPGLLEVGCLVTVGAVLDPLPGQTDG